MNSGSIQMTMNNGSIQIEGKSKPMSQVSRAYKAIKEAIMNLTLEPGQLISEIELSKQLEMSRTPIREAIARLKSEGLVEVIPRKGSFVKVLSSDDIRQIYEMAEALEGMMAYLASCYGNQEGIFQLGKSVKDMEDAHASGDVNKLILADENFHNILHKLCNNQFLVDSFSRMNDQIHRIRLMTKSAGSNSSESVKEHKETYEAIKKDDAELARCIVQRHWKRVRMEVINIIFPYNI